MDQVNHLWILLSNEAACGCNEPWDTSGAGKTDRAMDDALSSQVLTWAKRQGCRCTILAGREGLSPAVRSQVDGTAHRVVVPPDCRGENLGSEATVVLDIAQALGDGAFPQDAVILRVSQADLHRLAACVVQLLERGKDVMIRHPDLLKYDREDLEVYRGQLHEIGHWLLDRPNMWSSRHVDVLTDRLRTNAPQACGAGDTSLAVAPDGTLYLCPAAFHAGMEPCGHVAGAVDVPHRHLFTREYSTPCQVCDALHCSRCMYLNRLATYEYCVPAENVCRLAHVELAGQAWLAQEANKRGLWSNGRWKGPAPPAIEDPYQLVRAADDTYSDLWKRLLLFTGRRADLSPSMMLDILCSLQARLNAIRDCGVKAGHIVSSERMERNVLLYLRRKTVERYKEVVLEDGCPTIHEIEMSMHRMVEALAREYASVSA